MFGNTNNWGNPFQSQNLDQLQSQYQSQLETLNRMKAAQAQSNILDEINKELALLDKDEQLMLYESQDYLAAKSIYESAFLQFISNKFSAEYVNSPEGKEAAMGLLKTIKSSKERIALQTRQKAEKINKMLEMLESDPEMRRRYDELTGVKKPENNPNKRTPENNFKGGNNKQ
jgi:ribulose bisphosphate carboxylase small subunit